MPDDDEREFKSKLAQFIPEKIQRTLPKVASQPKEEQPILDDDTVSYIEEIGDCGDDEEEDEALQQWSADEEEEAELRKIKKRKFARRFWQLHQCYLSNTMREPLEIAETLRVQWSDEE